MAPSPHPLAHGRVSTVDALAGQLRDAILEGEIPAGSRLNEVALAKRYEVSRHTLRAALSQLVHDGLLRHVTNRGTFVPAPELDDLLDLHRFRATIEREALRQALARGVDFEGVARANRALDQLPDDASWSEVTDTHNRVHSDIVASAGSRRLSATYASIQGELTLFLRQLRPTYDQRGIVRIHGDLLDALLGARPREAMIGLDRDLDRGEQALRSPSSERQ